VKGLLMQTTKNRINIHAGYWSVCKTCCDWSDNTVEDSWNPSPGVGWYCPKCAGQQADKCETFPRLMPEPKPAPKKPEPTLWAKLCGGLVARWNMR
jgi:hypothetical protein